MDPLGIDPADLFLFLFMLEFIPNGYPYHFLILLKAFFFIITMFQKKVHTYIEKT